MAPARLLVKIAFLGDCIPSNVTRKWHGDGNGIDSSSPILLLAVAYFDSLRAPWFSLIRLPCGVGVVLRVLADTD